MKWPETTKIQYLVPQNDNVDARHLSLKKASLWGPIYELLTTPSHEDTLTKGFSCSAGGFINLCSPVLLLWLVSIFEQSCSDVLKSSVASGQCLTLLSGTLSRPKWIRYYFVFFCYLMFGPLFILACMGNG